MVYATKHLRHYLLGRPFKTRTDHAPLSAQKVFFAAGPLHYKNMISTLNTGKGARTAMQMHFHVRSQSAVGACVKKEELHLAQQQDAVLNQVLVALQTPSVNPKNTLW